MSGALLALALAGATPPAPTPSPTPTPKPSSVDITLTQERKPKAVAWQKPALLSYTIDRHGDDTVNVQINAALSTRLEHGGPRRIELGPYLIVNRNSQADAPQNNIEAGARLAIGTYEPLPADSDTPVEAGDDALDIGFSLDAGYARTIAYPDLASAACVFTPTLRQCSKQRKESFRSVLGLTPFIPGQEGNASGFSYSFALTGDLAFDHLFSNTVDTSTGIAETGDYLSANLGAALKLSPTFVAPNWTIDISGQVRPLITASRTRLPGIERWPGLFSASLTYYVLNPPDGTARAKWRAGISVSYSEGSDPLQGKPDASTILISFTLGRF